MAFGKRSGAPGAADPAAKPAMPAAPKPIVAKPAAPKADKAEKLVAAAPPKPTPEKAKPKPAAIKPPPAQPQEKVTKVTDRSEEYYATKTTIFNALIDTIDLGQLAQLDQESAREEIRDIVVEIIAIKNVVMSISEQEHLLDDICNDVLGYGPLEPLLARDDIGNIIA
ncbi:MAG: CpaF family protein, partial [Pseudomonadota bacterium]